MPLFAQTFDTKPYTFTGAKRREIAFPLGGIGTGCVSLDGRGGLRDWEIFNRPNKGSFLEYTFASLWVKPEGGESKALAVHGPRVGNWMGETVANWNYGHGRFFSQMDGLPGFDDVEFVGTFPFARLKFVKEDLPVSVELCAFNPFIPLDVRSSSFPLACLVYRVTNTGDVPVDLSLAMTMRNPVGEGVEEKWDEEKALNTRIDQDGLHGVRFTNERFGSGEAVAGTAAVATNWPDVTMMPQWKSEEWWDGVQRFWNSFRESGRFDSTETPQPGTRQPGSLGALARLEPGQSVEIPFTISWRFPTAVKYWGDDKGSHTWTPHYATEWPDAWDSAREFFSRYDELVGRTLAFEQALFSSTLPPDLIQSVSATASILHSPTVLRLEDGTFWAWEGCSGTEGCCEGTCSHVWNYALTHAYLFPDMQRSMRTAEYKNNFNCGPMGEKGALVFRTQIPLGKETQLWHAASDGQLGGVVQLYRDWRLSGDEGMLRELWPSAKKALEFAWVQWDRDRDGLVDGDQHNTYDINFQGPNPLTQFFYLAALRAGEAMARHMGQNESAEIYRDLHVQGSRLTEERIWNGEFFFQDFDCEGPGKTKYQHGRGCLTDQLLGQLAATVAGLGDLVDPEMVQAALFAVFKHNFKSPLGDHENLQRVYAVSDEPGLIMCSWPHGGRPEFPFPYSDEVWTGIEYQVASHLAFEGMVDEAMQIVSGVRQRYDGERRNPWNEFECGSHYARAMASYGVWLALTGFRHDAVAGTTTLEPRWEAEDFKCFFCTPQGWGLASEPGPSPRLDYVEQR